MMKIEEVEEILKEVCNELDLDYTWFGWDKNEVFLDEISNEFENVEGGYIVNNEYFLPENRFEMVKKNFQQRIKKISRE